MIENQSALYCPGPFQAWGSALQCTSITDMTFWSLHSTKLACSFDLLMSETHCHDVCYLDKTVAVSGHYKPEHQSQNEHAKCSKATGCLSKYRTLCERMCRCYKGYVYGILFWLTLLKPVLLPSLLRRGFKMGHFCPILNPRRSKTCKQHSTRQDVHEGDNSHPTSYA